MKRVLLFQLAVLVAICTPSIAQEVVSKGWINIPGLGPKDLSTLPDDLRSKIQIPGQADTVTEDDTAATTPEPSATDTLAPVESAVAASEEPLTVKSRSTPATDEERKAFYDAVRQTYPEMPRNRPTPASSQAQAPEDAYTKALDQVRRMDSGEKVPSSTPEPQSWMQATRSWLAALPSALGARPAVADPPVCSGTLPLWQPIGPAPHTLFNTAIPTPGYVKNAGIVKFIAVDKGTYDPMNQISKTIYLGARDSGFWKTTDSTNGPSWSTTTDTPVSPNKTSLQIEAIAVHPIATNVVFAGTGLGTKLQDATDETPLTKSIGILRSTDGGNSWLQIGPNPDGTDKTQSSVNVKEIRVDTTRPTVRIWAATSRGLFRSDEAADQSNGPSQINWTQVASLSTSTINHILVDPYVNSTTQTLYASLASGGWQKSTNAGTSWAPINSGLPANPLIGRAALHRNSNGATGSIDAIFTVVVGDTAPNLCGSARDRLYRFTPSQNTWTILSPTGMCEGQPCNDNPNNGPICDCCNVVEVAPDDVTNVVAGGRDLYHSNNGWNSATRIGLGTIHADQNALLFDPNNSDVLYIGTDGGPWKRQFSTDKWTFLHGNLANLEFYHGTTDSLNYGNTGGGTQDNNTLKGGTSLEWTRVDAFGDGKWLFFDPKDSNTTYMTGSAGSTVKKSVDGGLGVRVKQSGFPPPIDVHSDDLAIDPTDSKTLVAYSTPDHRIYRTGSGGELAGTCGSPWCPISQSLTSPQLEIISLAVAPTASTPSNLIYAGTQNGNGLWRTTPTTFSTWARVDGGTLPNAPIGSIAFDTSDPLHPCTESTCIVYVTIRNVGTGHVYRSTDGGSTFTNISGSLPDVPANALALHIDPSDPDPDAIFVGTDLGLYRGTFNGSSWDWCSYMSGFPKTALVKGLAVVKETGMLRALTFGRSAWETKVFSIPNSDAKVNNTTPNTQALAPRVSSGVGGSRYAVAWLDDRTSSGKWHAYYKAYSYSGGTPTPTNTEFQVDSLSSAQSTEPSLSLSAHPTQTTAPYCARHAWADKRANGVNPRIYSQYACSDTYRLWTFDLLVDDVPSSGDATNPAITFQQTLDFAVAWQAGTSSHKIYARFFSSLGGPKIPFGGNQATGVLTVNTSSLDATAPAVASDGNSSVYIAWQEKNSTTEDFIYARAYNNNGVVFSQPVRLDDSAVTNAGDVSITTDGTGNVVITWSEAASGQPRKIVGKRCNNNLSSCVALDGQCLRCVAGDPTQLNLGCATNSDCGVSGVCQSAGTASCAPLLPAGAQIAKLPVVATDQAGNISIVWQGNPSDGGATPTYSAIGRSFTSALASARRDFRIDLAGRVTVETPGVARGDQSNVFAYAWRDSRSGKPEVYTRRVTSLP